MASHTIADGDTLGDMMRAMTMSVGWERQDRRVFARLGPLSAFLYVLSAKAKCMICMCMCCCTAVDDVSYDMIRRTMLFFVVKKFL